MSIQNSDLVSLFEKALSHITPEPLEEIGIVTQVGDNICRVHGLTNVFLGELVTFDGGNRGIVMSMDELQVSVLLFERNIPVNEQEIVKRTGSIFKIPVSNNLLGRIIDVTGMALDSFGSIDAQEYRPIEADAPGIIERSPVNESLETGITAIDALVPIGKGQRELIIGNRNTGKTALVIDTIVHQKNKNVLCVYVSIGQRQASLIKFAQQLMQYGALDYTVIVSAEASESILKQYLAPYVGATISEYFRDQAKDVLVIYDDLSSHAVAYREMSLLLRRPPGREAYPGDVFYLHSRLLERAGKLADGGSITALPVVQIQSDDITAYIPTNLISITDGQIFLDSHMFNQGIRPAVNVELSVSRVGGAAQTKAIKKVTRALRLELAQYNELLDFAQFGTELDAVSQKKLQRGAIAVELLKQKPLHGYTFVDQTLMLFLLKESFLDDITLPQVHAFADKFISYIEGVHPELYSAIEKTKDLQPELEKKLIGIAKEFHSIFANGM